MFVVSVVSVVLWFLFYEFYPMNPINSMNSINSINSTNPTNPIWEVKMVYVPLRIIFTGLLFYAAYRFGKAVAKEEARELTKK